MLKPIDIQNKEFEKKIKGYDCDEVDDFLDVIIQDFEILYQENQELKDKLGLLTEVTERYKLMEVTMRQSVDVAKASAEEVRKNAELEAQNIIAQAKLDASRLAKQIDEEHLKRHREMLSTKTQIEAYKTRAKGITESILKLLDDME